MHFFWILWGPQRGPGLISYFLQLYSLSRVGVLLAITLSMVVFDSTHPINCQVIPVSHTCFVSYTAP